MEKSSLRNPQPECEKWKGRAKESEHSSRKIAADCRALVRLLGNTESRLFRIHTMLNAAINPSAVEEVCSLRPNCLPPLECLLEAVEEEIEQLRSYLAGAQIPRTSKERRA